MNIEEIITECNHHHRARLCDECALRNKIETLQKEVEEKEDLYWSMKERYDNAVVEIAQLKKQLEVLKADDKQMNKLLDEYEEALKKIESLCDNQNPTHKNIWLIAYNQIKQLLKNINK